MEKEEKTKWSIAAASWAVTCPSPRIKRTRCWTSALGRTHLWIAIAHVCYECNLTVMWMSVKCTKWNMNARQVSWKCPARAGRRPKSHFYRKYWGNCKIQPQTSPDFHHIWVFGVLNTPLPQHKETQDIPVKASPLKVSFLQSKKLIKCIMWSAVSCSTAKTILLIPTWPLIQLAQTKIWNSTLQIQNWFQFNSAFFVSFELNWKQEKLTWIEFELNLICVELNLSLFIYLFI